MNRIYLTYANHHHNPLPGLKEEDEEVNSLLARREAEGHFSVGRESFAELPRIIENLLLFRQQLMVFSYSGHAGRDHLILEDSPANAKGIAALLGACPKLHLVILNGCSTQGQVTKLLDKGIPIVIATSAAVEDDSASQFAISFFQSFIEQESSIEVAFDAGIAAAQSSTNRSLKVTKSRSVFQRQIQEEVHPSWGIYYRDDDYLKWTFPSKDLGYHYEPNEILIDSLIEAFAPYQVEAAEILEQQEMGLEQDLMHRRAIILKHLPLPISEQLRKLLAPNSVNQGEIFFDQPGIDRLRQISTTYQTVVEFISFALLAQLWDNFSISAQNKTQIGSCQQIKDFLKLSRKQRKAYDFLPLIQNIRDIIATQKQPFFMSELPQLIQFWEEDNFFSEACLFMETLKKRLQEEDIDKTTAQELSIQSEEELSNFFQALGFLVHYTLISINEIGVIKNRSVTIAKYYHKLFKLVQQFGTDIIQESVLMNDTLSNDSVLLQRQGQEAGPFLNLSPFIIDRNAFDTKTSVTKLHFFEAYERKNDLYVYKHAYKPDDLPLVIRREKDYLPLKAQFNAFSQLVFQKKMKFL